jgi:soluble lytic murein transglycosylase
MVIHELMKFLGILSVLLTILGSIYTSKLVVNYRIDKLIEIGKIPYGPLPNKSLDLYSFHGVEKAFDSSVDLSRVSEFSKKDFEDLILIPLELKDREELNIHLKSILNTAVDYQIDPFWILAIMMSESGFDKNAKSNKNARGLMQIQPETAEHLYQLMRKNLSEVQLNKNLHTPDENIEVGIFYLKKLLQNFRLNYKLATIAYNYGPNKLKNLIEYDEIVPENVEYLAKVRESYKFFSGEYLKRLKQKDSLAEMLFDSSESSDSKSPNTHYSVTLINL